MEDRRHALKWIALAASARTPLLGEDGQHLRDEVVSEGKAKLNRDPFGDTRIYFQGPTSQLKSMTAGSLLLKPGMEPHVKVLTARKSLAGRLLRGPVRWLRLTWWRVWT